MPTILVADDNSNIQKMVSLVFKEKGIRVVAVGNGEAACRKVPEVQPDVVLADVFMPVRNGYEVCEFVKQDPQFAETPVILLVGAFDPLDEKEAQRVGANGVLKKPFVPPEPLIAMVNSLLGTAEPTGEEAPPAAEAAAAPPAAPPAPVREFRAAPASLDYGEADETVATFSEPVATPSAKDLDAEVEGEAEPASDWARRRADMDYEIDSAESTNLVEKLAAETTAEESEILAGSQHLPFGGANVPEPLSAGAAESSPGWAELTSPVTPPPVVEASAPEIEVPEISGEGEAAGPASSIEESAPGPESPFDLALPQADELASPGPQAAPEREAAAPWTVAPVPAEPSREASASRPWPHPQEVPAAIEPSQPSSQERAFWPAAAGPSLALPEALGETAPVPAEPASKAVTPEAGAPAEKPSAKAGIDQATVDEVVAQVISKLEPQLHQALANGVLRPLVEELLNQHRDKK